MEERPASVASAEDAGSPQLSDTSAPGSPQLEEASLDLSLDEPSPMPSEPSTTAPTPTTSRSLSRAPTPGFNSARTASAYGAGSLPVEEQEGDELAAFRKEWQSEVQRRRQAPPAAAPATAAPAAPDKGKRPDSSRNDDEHSSSEDEQPHSQLQRDSAASSTAAGPSEALQAARVARAAVAAAEDAATLQTEEGRKQIHEAVLVYAKAVGAERRGDTDEAIKYYRRAFRLHDEVDRLWQRAYTLLSADAEAQKKDTQPTGPSQPADALLSVPDITQAVDAALDFDDSRYLAMQTRAHAGPIQSSTTAKRLPLAMPDVSETALLKPAVHDETLSLSPLLEKLSLAPESEDGALTLRARFTPEDEEQPVPISTLPDELFGVILSFLAAPRGRRGAKISPAPPGEPPSSRGVGMVLGGADWVSVERVGRACATLRRLTTSSSLWREILRHTYWPPQIPASVKLPSLIEAHGGDPRTTFIDQPRLRLNGVYIAACHYARQGMHESNVWIRVVHLVEYYRSIRFLPDGRALSLLSTDVPADTVRHMEPGFKSKGFAIGRWQLHPNGLHDDETCGRPQGPKIIVEDLKDRTMEKYSFRMIFLLRQTARGRWNKLDLLDYESVNLQTAEACAIPQKHEKPFHFSPVRSYGI